MATNDKGQGVKSADLKKMTALDRLAQKVLQNADPGYIEKYLLTAQDAKFQKIIDRQLDVAKGVAGNQIVDFFATVRTERRSGRPPKKLGIETADLFTENVGDIFGYFQDVYKNRYMEVQDLKFISRFIPSLGEGVRIYLDAIISSDDVSDVITRNLQLNGLTSDEDKNTAMSKIEQIERENKVLQKLKVAYNKTLVSGSFFVYHISYKDLFEMYSAGVASGKIERRGTGYFINARNRQDNINQSKPGRLRNANESAAPDYIPMIGCASLVRDAELSTVLENFGVVGECVEPFIDEEHGIFQLDYKTSAMKNALNYTRNLVQSAPDPSFLSPTRDRISKDMMEKQLIASLESELPNIYFMESPIPMDVLSEIGGREALEAFNEYFNLRKDVDENIDKLNRDSGIMTDGAYDPNRIRSGRGQSFADIPGTYLKWIDYKYVIPIDVLGHRVGYYHIITTTKTRKNTGRGGNKATEIGGILSSGSMSLFDQLDVSEKRKETAIQNIVDAISDGIVTQFSSKFVRKNAAFKKLIADCIIANGLVNNDYMIQFIPVENMIEFKCNEDEEGRGTSILSDAMFPAHLLLSIVICKMLNYINKSGNRTIAHISSGRVNRSLSNQVNRVIRDLQAGNVTFTDLLSSSMVFSKVTRDSNIAMPKDQQGNRLVEFEVQEGQDIDLNTNYETMLERWGMIAMGMPPTIMDYNQDVNVAKRVVSDNVRVAGRVASLQSDFETPTTELYRVLINDSDMDNSLKTALSNSLQFKLPRPRILANQNNSEALGTAYQNAQTIADIKLGQDTGDEEMAQRRVKFIEAIVRRETPYLQWNELDDLYDQARIDVIADEVKKAADTALQEGSAKQENPDDGLSDLDPV